MRSASVRCSQRNDLSECVRRCVRRADIAVFDPNRVIDKATYEKPDQYSEGFRYVLVDGVLVVRDGQLRDGVAPGQGIRAR